MRLAQLIEKASVVAIHGAGVHPRVNAQQGHSHIFEIPAGERPEAAVRISILWAHPRVHDKRTLRRCLEHLLPENVLTSRQYEIWLNFLKQLQGFGAIWARRLENPTGGWDITIALEQTIQRNLCPCAVGSGERKPVIQVEGEHVKESKQPNSPDLATDALIETGLWLMDNHDGDQVGKGRQPSRQAQVVQRLVVVTNQNGSRLSQLRATVSSFSNLFFRRQAEPFVPCGPKVRPI
jgi:hypothetical protein